jgi:hypothetical protein
MLQCGALRILEIARIWPLADGLACTAGFDPKESVASGRFAALKTHHFLVCSLTISHQR